MVLRSIDWKEGKIVIIDQTQLPRKLSYRELKTVDDVAEAIVNMRVRGAPLIGVTAALGMALAAHHSRGKSSDEILKALKMASEKLLKTRPTAVNLRWAVNKILQAAYENKDDVVEVVIDLAVEIMNQDIEINKRMADVGQAVINDDDVILTHCNTGSLATVSIGTALGVIIEAYKRGKKIKVYATETRPRLQGAKLTAFELIYEGLDATLISDTAVAHTIITKGVNKIMVGADRILSDGTTYNKIGTLQLAILAKHFGIPMYIVAPTSTIDMESRREDVVIEERDPDEVRKIGDNYIAPKDIPVYNPAFDETPPELISGIITEKGLIRPPFEDNIRGIMV